MANHACDSCGRIKNVMIAMMPGRDKQPWSLCSVCWLEGAVAMKLGNIPAPRELPEVGSHAGMRRIVERLKAKLGGNPDAADVLQKMVER